MQIGILNKPKVSGIYYIYCLGNNKGYIGAAVDIYNRYHVHKHNLENNKHHSKYLQAAWNKYGSENFTFTILVSTTKLEYIRNLESWFIQKSEVDSSFNMVRYSEHKPIMHEESKRKLSERLKGKIRTKEHRDTYSRLKKEKFKDVSFKERIYNNLPKLKGEDAGRAKITEYQAIEIINRINEGERPISICKDYPINNRMVTEIKKGRAWKHLSHLINSLNVV